MQVIKQNIFKEYSSFLYRTTGIYLQEHKKHLLRSKLNRLLAKSGVESAADYLDIISCPENVQERQRFIDMMTTNTTQFFRETGHFDFLRDRINLILNRNPRIHKEKTIRIWSSACSTGQEPVTLALVMRELLGKQFNVRILATDISSEALSRALKGIYTQNECAGIPKLYLNRYFEKYGDGYKLNNDLGLTITYRQFNLMNEYRFKWGFDIIFCRNVMIYFDNQVQQKLVNKLYQSLASGGLLFLGHSESLINKKHCFQSIGHSIYQKP